MEILLKIEGMKCGGCVSAVEKSLIAQQAVRSVKVDLETGSAVITHDDGDIANFVAAVEDAGFDAAIAPAD